MLEVKIHCTVKQDVCPISQGERFLPKFMHPGVFRLNLGEIGYYCQTADSNQICAGPKPFCVANEALLAWGVNAFASAILEFIAFRM